jgi:hypothetical protein
VFRKQHVTGIIDMNRFAHNLVLNLVLLVLVLITKDNLACGRH